VQQISPYQPGKPIDELKRELGLDDIVKLASNENPLGCSPLAVAAIQAEMTQIGRYPDGNAFALKETIRQKFGFAHNRITPGNGSNDILELVRAPSSIPVKRRCTASTLSRFTHWPSWPPVARV